MKNTTKSYFAGAFVYMGFSSLWQDYIGRELYIEWVKERWVDSNITIPVAIIFLLVGLAIHSMALISENKNSKRLDDENS